MSWDYQRSLDRIKRHLEQLDASGPIETPRLTREMDLDNLSETKCRRIYGAHVYVEIPRFTQLVTDGDDEDSDAYKELIRALHVYQRELSRIVESVDIFDSVRVHFQGSRLHALLYRPVGDAAELSAKAVLLQLVLKSLVRNTFNPLFPDCGDFDVAGGADIGEVIGTRNGMAGERELLFIGGAANHAAKMLSSAGRMRLSARLYEELPEMLQDVCDSVADHEDLYQLGLVAADDLDDMLAEFGIDWTAEASRKRVQNDIDATPLDVISYSGARELIDLDSLSIRNNKRVVAATIYVDITGFTAYIDAATTDEERQTRLRALHAMRREMSRVVRRDYDGLHVQFQGDRIQGLFHMPPDEGAQIARRSVETASGLQSSMEVTIRECLGDDVAGLEMAIGIDIGTTLLSKLGTRGDRDRICMGEAVQAAARCEERCTGGQTGITGAVYQLLPDDLAEHFTFDRSSGCYVACQLTSDRIAVAAKARLFDGQAPLFIKSVGAGVTVEAERARESHQVRPSRSYAG